MTEISEHDREIIRFYSAPAHHETIAAHLIRLSTHRHVKGDEMQKGFLISDYTKRLFMDKVTELDLFEACEHFIESDTSEFFPSYSKLKKRIWS